MGGGASELNPAMLGPSIRPRKVKYMDI